MKLMRLGYYNIGPETVLIYTPYLHSQFTCSDTVRRFTLRRAWGNVYFYYHVNIITTRPSLKLESFIILWKSKEQDRYFKLLYGAIFL